MKINISLALYNGKGSMAGIEAFEDMGGSLDIAGGMSMSPRLACMSAAKALRAAAERFDRLAGEDDPYNYKTQRKINRQKVSA